MPPDEQRRRMRKMRQQVDEHNIFRWAGMLLSEVGRMVEPTDPPEPEGVDTSTEDRRREVLAGRESLDAIALTRGAG
jgi:trehalose 6-phosphate synthase